MNITTGQFEGPLSLLLQIIEKEEMDITQVSLAKIADQYVEYLKKAKDIDPEEMADFLVVAAKLLLIKSKALLPYLFPEEEEEIKEFEEQLRMYKEFLEATKKIEAMIGKKKFMFAREFNRQAILQSAKLFAPPKDLKPQDLASVLGEIIERVKPAEQDLEEKTLERKINIEEKIIHIQQSLLQRLSVSFNKIMATAENKTEVIVSFLAMLELIKQREITADQGELFEEIVITRNC